MLSEDPTSQCRLCTNNGRRAHGHDARVDRVGIEGTGSHGAGLCRWLTARGLIVVEVDRPDRGLRRNRGESDTMDAEAAARKMLSGEATAIPEAQDGNVGEAPRRHGVGSAPSPRSPQRALRRTPVTSAHVGRFSVHALDVEGQMALA